MEELKEGWEARFGAWTLRCVKDKDGDLYLTALNDLAQEDVSLLEDSRGFLEHINFEGVTSTIWEDGYKNLVGESDYAFPGHPKLREKEEG